MVRRKKSEGTNLSTYRMFNQRQYRLHGEYPKFHSRITEDAEDLRELGYLVRTIRTAYGFVIYKRKK